MSDLEILSDFLRDLAETLDGCEWNHPLGSAAKCRLAADEIEAMIEALRMLMDEQNGAPLHRRAREWHAAMAEACRLTGRVKDQKRHNETAAPAAKE